MNRTVIDLLESSGYQGYVVGGAVRDDVLKRSSHDTDIVTNASVEDMKEVFLDYKIIETGLKHDTLTVVIEGNHFEVTSFRQGATSIEEDVRYRDFTMNALVWQGEILDFVGGMDDIKAKIIRCVGSSSDRFKEDPLRILRALRFAAQYGFTIENETRASVFLLKDTLSTIAKERILVEFIKILEGEFVKPVLLEYYEVIGVFIPEILAMAHFEQHNPHHIFDVLEHTCCVVENVDVNRTLRLAAFFHDSGKPSTFSQDSDGIGHFYKHALVSEDIARTRLRELKCDHKTIDDVCMLVRLHDNTIQVSKKSVKKVLAKISQELFEDLLCLKRADNLGQNPEFKIEASYFASLSTLAQQIMDANEVVSLDQLAINGHDIIELGVAPGPLVGELLNYLLVKTLDDELVNDRSVLIEYLLMNYFS